MAPNVPMDVDSGQTSLEQSRHHPLAAPRPGIGTTMNCSKPGCNSAETAQKTAENETQKDNVQNLLSRLIALVPEDNRDQARSLAMQIAETAKRGAVRPTATADQQLPQNWNQVRKLV